MPVNAEGSVMNGLILHNAALGPTLAVMPQVLIRFLSPENEAVARLCARQGPPPMGSLVRGLAAAASVGADNATHALGVDLA
jgi:hypothetical protein